VLRRARRLLAAQPEHLRVVRVRGGRNRLAVLALQRHHHRLQLGLRVFGS